MEKFLGLCAVALLAVLLFSGCVQQPSSPGPSPGQPGNQDQQPDAGDGLPPGAVASQAADHELINKASSEQDISYCGQIQNQALVGQCLRAVLSADTDPALCAQFSDSEISDKCYNNLVNLTNDTSLCDNIVDEARQQKCRLKS
jgi:hypothetical protein